MLEQRHVIFFLIIDSLKRLRTQRRLRPSCKNFTFLNQRREIIRLEIFVFHKPYLMELRKLDQPLRNSKRNMEVLVNSTFQKRSIIFLRRKNGDMINGQSFILVRMYQISMIRILRQS